MKRFIVLLLSVTMLFVLTSCSKIGKRNPDYIKNGYDSDYPVTINDVSFTSAPKKVVSLSPALTEIIFELGLEKKLVGRSEYCTYPKKAEKIKAVGSPAKPDIDAIVSLKPDVVITQSPVATIDKSTLEKKGIKVLTISSPRSFYEFIDVYGAMAKVFLGNIKSDITVEKALKSLDTAMTKSGDKKHGKKFVYIISEQMAVATGDTLESDILGVFGDNIAKEKKNYSMTSAEIIAAAPDTIFISDKIDIQKLPEDIRTLITTGNVKLIKIDNTYFEKPTVRLKAIIEDAEKQLSAQPSTETNGDNTEK